MSARTVQLGDLIEIAKGKKASQVFERPTKNARRYLQIDDLRPDAKPKFVEPFNCPEASRSDVVIAWDGANAGTVSYNLDGFIGSTLAVLRPINGKTFGPYLARYLEGNFRLLQAQSTGATVPHLDREVLEQLEIPLPHLSEQRRITRLLGQADRLRRIRRYTLKLSDTFLFAAFLELFGDLVGNRRWPLVPFGDLIASGPQNGLYKPASAYGSGTRIVRIDAYQSGQVIDFDKLKRVRLSPAEMDTYRLVRGDFLVNRVNSRSHLGKSTYIPRLSEPTVYESNMMRFRVNDKRLDPAYTLQFLQTSFLNAQIQRQAKDASNQASINQEDVEGLAILLPPLSLQRDFAALASRHECLQARLCESLRQADHLFASLLHRAFTAGL